MTDDIEKDIDDLARLLGNVARTDVARAIAEQIAELVAGYISVEIDQHVHDEHDKGYLMAHPTTVTPAKAGA